jgi:hypothetical protein
MRLGRVCTSIVLLIGLACDLEETTSPDQELVAIGCFLQSGGASLSLGDLAATGQIYFPSGNYVLDNFYQQEGLALVSTFGLSPRGFWFYDQSPNAMATPEVANQFGPDGTILFGQNLLLQQLSTDPSGATVVAIMAHEFGHLAQFREAFREAGKRPELHADFMAGWYLRIRGRSWANFSSALRVFYELGDYEFNSPQHHGTPQERLAAAQAGFDSGAQSAAQAYNLGWQFVR